MAGRLDGRVAVIVGAGQSPGETVGNGRATAVTFAREGASLLLVDRDADSLEETASLAATASPVEAASSIDGDVVTLTVDITDDDGPDRVLAAALEAFGRVDILHNMSASASAPVTGPRTTSTTRRSTASWM